VSDRPRDPRLLAANAPDDEPAGFVAGGVLFATLVYVIANLVVDISYAYVDPRIRLED
jgi:peptide/nickel transport system permease protein